MNKHFSKEELEEIRRKTPGTSAVIHFNNAGSSLMPTSVFEAVNDYLRDELYLGGYETAAKWEKRLASCYDAIADLINADRDEIAMVESATAAWYKAFHSMTFEQGDKILCCESEYGSNFIGLLQAQKQKGIEIGIVPSTETGEVDLGALEQMIDHKVKLIILTHIPTNGGLVNPAEEVGKIAEKHGVPYLLDACQAVGQYPVDVKKLKCTFLAATGRKYMRAPRGTGFLYINKDQITRAESVFPDMLGGDWTSIFEYQARATAKKFENFEYSRAGLIGLGEAARYINELGIGRIWAQVQTNASYLREQLGGIEHVQLTDQGLLKSGLVTFLVKDKGSYEVQGYLRNSQINVSVSGIWSTRIDMEKRGLEDLIRVSVHYFNTVEEMDLLVKRVQSIG
ncbi:MAG: aminotransferase class V-fold PLP-dependent enzyme [Bacteroidia bacterium]|nr:aminotransferase class V-fold PLP-dependent enzyme [Bacteroidia bacterium]